MNLREKHLILVLYESDLIKNELQAVLGTHYDLVCIKTDAAHPALYAGLHPIAVMIESEPKKMPVFKKIIQDIQNTAVTAHIIMITASSELTECIEFMNAGASHYIEFPTEISLLQKIIGPIPFNIEEKDLFKYVMFKSLETHPELKKSILSEHLEKQGAPNYKTLFAFYSLSDILDHKIPIDPRITQELIRHMQTETSPQILVVEDEPILRAQLIEHLKNKNYHIYGADSAEAALVEISKGHSFQVAIVDIGLPGMSGTQLLPYLKKNNPTIESMMLTAFQDIKMVIDAFEKGAYDYITKPYQDQVLLKKIELGLRRYYFKQLPAETLTAIIKKMPRKQRLAALSDLAHYKKKIDSHLTVADLLFLFPNIQNTGLNPENPIPEKIIKDGLGLFLDTLNIELKEGRTGASILENWDEILKAQSRENRA